MEKIAILKTQEQLNCWKFSVSVGSGADSLDYTITIDKEYWQKITGGTVVPAAFLTHSLAFLLDREPKEAILRSFNLKEIKDYFGDYEEEMKRVLAPRK